MAIEELTNPERNTLTVDFMELANYNQDVASLILQHFYRLKSYFCSTSYYLLFEEIKGGPRKGPNLSLFCFKANPLPLVDRKSRFAEERNMEDGWMRERRKE